MLASGTLTFEAQVQVTNIHKGACVGLTYPWGGVYQNETALVCLRDGIVFVSGMTDSTGNPVGSSAPVPSGFTGLATFKPLAWYLVKAVCHFGTKTMDVYLNGAQIGSAVPKFPSPTYGYAVSEFIITGTYFANEP